MKLKDNIAWPDIKLATLLRVEAAKARLKLGEARLISGSDGDITIDAIQDKDGVVVLDYDY